MKDKKKYITLYYISYLSLALAFLCFFRYLFHRRYPELICFIAFLLGYFVLFRICSKAVQCEEGYSLVQAVAYYRACALAGYKETNKQKDVAVLSRVAERCDYLEDKEHYALKTCYFTGKQADKAVTNPLVRFLWLLRDKMLKRGGKNNV